MALNPDFRDLFAAFNAADVRYLVVGGYALTFHGRPRFTKDLDVWVDPAPANAARVRKALSAFGAPLLGMAEADFRNPERVLQIGVAPNRIDVLMGISGVEFGEAWEHRAEATYGDCPIHVLGREHLLRNKRASGRPRDLEDVRDLEGGSEDDGEAP
jgi:hypothetical protein